jgi:hypothetical protein
VKSREYDFARAEAIIGRYGWKIKDRVIHALNAKDTSNRASGAIDYLIRFHGMVMGK